MEQLIKVDAGTAILKPEISSQIADFERMAKDIKSKQEALKKAILEEMEQKNIVKIETDDLTITYVAPTDRESFNTKRFKEEFPLTYDEFVTMSPVKSSIRIKVK